MKIEADRYPVGRRQVLMTALRKHSQRHVPRDCCVTGTTAAASSAENQPLAAVLFLYQPVLKQPLDRIEKVVQARRPKRLLAVLSRDEAQAILSKMAVVPRLTYALLYSAGLRLLEGLPLRVKDLDFGRREITVRLGCASSEGSAARLTVCRKPSPARAGLRPTCRSA